MSSGFIKGKYVYLPGGTPGNAVIISANETLEDSGSVPGGGSGATNLTAALTATTVTIESSTGLDAAIGAATGSNAGIFTAANHTKLAGVESGATADQTNSEILNAWEAITGRTVATDGSKLDGIEALADVTDATNVNAAGAVMEADASTATFAFVIDDDSFATASATTLATSESIKALVDAAVIGAGAGDVVGPASAVNEQLAVYDGTTGKLIKDSGINISAVTGAALAYDSVQTIYVSAGGNDSNDGLSPDEPKLTIGGAITAASALTPASDNIIVISGTDAAEYAEDITVPRYVFVDMPNAHLLGGVSSTNPDGGVRFHRITKSTNGNAVLLNSATAGQFWVTVDRIDIDGTANGIACAQAAALIADVKTLVNGGTNHAVVGLTSAPGHIHYEGEDIYLTSTGYGIGLAIGGTMHAHVKHILNSGAGAGTAVNADAGTIFLNANDLSVTSAWDIEIGATLYIDCDVVTESGSSANDGTLVDWKATVGTALQPSDVDDVAVNGVTTAPISSNWAYDHENNTANPHNVTAAQIGVEAGADVTDTTNVTAAGALMDSEVTNLAAVKAFDPADYATNTALQPADIASGTITALAGALNLSAGVDGDVLTQQADGSLALETPAAGGGSVAGSDTQFQYNNGGAFGGAAGALYNDATGAVTLSHSGADGTYGLTVTATADSGEFIQCINDITFQAFAVNQAATGEGILLLFAGDNGNAKHYATANASDPFFVIGGYSADRVGTSDLTVMGTISTTVSAVDYNVPVVLASAPPSVNDFARFSAAGVLEGRSYSETLSDLGLYAPVYPLGVGVAVAGLAPTFVLKSGRPCWEFAAGQKIYLHFMIPPAFAAATTVTFNYRIAFTTGTSGAGSTAAVIVRVDKKDAADTEALSFATANTTDTVNAATAVNTYIDSSIALSNDDSWVANSMVTLELEVDAVSTGAVYILGSWLTAA